MGRNDKTYSGGAAEQLNRRALTYVFQLENFDQWIRKFKEKESHLGFPWPPQV
jgi:hypothetical protein